MIFPHLVWPVRTRSGRGRVVVGLWSRMMLKFRSIFVHARYRIVSYRTLNFPFFYFIFYLNVPLKNFVCRWCAACTSHVFPNFFCLFGRWKSWNDFSLNCAKFSHSLAGVEIRLTNGGSDFATKSLGRRGGSTKELEPQWHATEGRQSSLVTKSPPMQRANTFECRRAKPYGTNEKRQPISRYRRL